MTRRATATARCHRPPSRSAASAAVLALWAVGAAADGATQLPRPGPDSPPAPFELLSPTLAATPIEEIVSLAPGGITFIPAPAAANAPAPASAPAPAGAAPPARKPVTVPWSGVAAIVPAGWFGPPSRGVAAPPSPPEPVSVLRLTDGSRIVGAIPRGTPPTEQIAWVHGRLGRFSPRLDAVAGFELDNSPSTAPARATPGAPAPAGPGGPGNARRDVLTLTNGDTLSGFLLGVALITSETAPASLVVRMEMGEGVTNVPVDRVVRAELANPSRSATGPRLWLSDGTVFTPLQVLGDAAGFSVRIERDDQGAAEVALGPSLVSAYAPQAQRLVPLAGLPVREQAPAPGRRWAPPVETARPAAGAPPELLGAADITIPGPMSVAWELPAVSGATAAHLGAFLTLPDSALAWGDFTVTVELRSPGAEPRTVATARLNAARPSVPISAALSLPGGAPSRLVVTVSAGPLGPVQNTLVLRRALLVLAEPPAPPWPENRGNPGR